MEKNSGHSLCILCCHSFPNSSANSPPTHSDTVKTVNKFVQQTGVVNSKCLSSGGLLGFGQLSICGECLSGLGNAVDKKSQVEEVEEELKSLQEEILRLKGQLGNLMEEQLEGMSSLEGRIKNGDEGCLRVIAGMAGQPKKEEGSWTWDNVFQFRDGIVTVANQLRDDLAIKRDWRIGGNDEIVPVANLLEDDDKGHCEISVESEASLLKIINLNIFCKLPEECIEGCLLPFLPWNDLLRFRRVCKFLHQVTTTYMQVHPNLAPEIEINEEDRNFGAFLEMNIPSNKFFFNNVSGLEFYDKESENMVKFVDKYGHLIRSLKVKQLSLSLLVKHTETQILRQLASLGLQHLEAECYGVGNHGKDPGSFVINDLHCFENLESIKIGQSSDLRYTSILMQTQTFLYTEFCKKLKFVSMPFHPYSRHYWGPDNLSVSANAEADWTVLKYAFQFAFYIVRCYVNDRKLKFPDQPNLQAFDFACYYDKQDWGNDLEDMMVDTGAKEFLRLCNTCNENGVKLWNVNACWFSGRLLFPELDSLTIGNAVVSMVQLHSSVLSLEMPNLERLEIKTTIQYVPTQNEWLSWRPDWPALKSLDINVDSKATIYEDGRNGGVPNIRWHFTTDIYDFCFKEICRPALTELRLSFSTDSEGLPTPKADHIVSCCPNLKKLTLVNWPGTNKSLLKLWEGLRGLEEVSLEYCKNVGNVTFVGLDTKNPIFFKLKNLRKLSLKGLDRMPKITDLLFSMVISKLSLTHFVITSDNPVESVTLNGIRSLLDGKFAASIEKFQFKKWSLANVSEDEFQQLETQFRSYEML